MCSSDLRTEEEVRDEMRPVADIAVRRALVLGELATLEGIAVEEAEVDAEVARLEEVYGDDALRALVEAGGVAS